MTILSLLAETAPPLSIYDVEDLRALDAIDQAAAPCTCSDGSTCQHAAARFREQRDKALALAKSYKVLYEDTKRDLLGCFGPHSGMPEPPENH